MAKVFTMTKKWYTGTPEKNGSYICAVRYNKATLFETLSWTDYEHPGYPRWMRYEPNSRSSNQTTNGYVPLNDRSPDWHVDFWAPYVDIVKEWDESEFVEEIEK